MPPHIALSLWLTVLRVSFLLASKHSFDADCLVCGDGVAKGSPLCAAAELHEDETTSHYDATLAIPN
jgi:hypothetical protein